MQCIFQFLNISMEWNNGIGGFRVYSILGNTWSRLIGTRNNARSNFRCLRYPLWWHVSSSDHIIKNQSLKLWVIKVIKSNLIKVVNYYSILSRFFDFFIRLLMSANFPVCPSPSPSVCFLFLELVFPIKVLLTGMLEFKGSLALFWPPCLGIWPLSSRTAASPALAVDEVLLHMGWLQPVVIVIIFRSF